MIQLLPSGDFRHTCPDCGTTTTASDPVDFDGVVCCPRPAVRYLAPLRCLQCAEPLGDVVLPSPTTPIVLPAALRCGRCGGNPWPTGDVDAIRDEPSLHFEPMRRGRPPRWLQDLNRRLATT